jgi:hypothetical protein
MLILHNFNTSIILMIKLAIAIPTFNRPEKLLKTVGALLAHSIPDCVEIVIIDNASAYPVEQLVLDHYPSLKSFTRFYRNVSNIGLGANLLRCFEHSGSNWTWLLGDDDTPLENAILKILAEIDAAGDDDVLIKFNSANGGEVSNYERIYSLSELSIRCNVKGFYSNLLFISSSVFRTSTMLQHLGIGYHWNYSLSPHVAMLIKAMSYSGSIQLVPLHIVSHGRPDSEQQWNVVRLVTGFTTLADIEGAEKFQLLAMPYLMDVYLGGGWLRSMLKAFLTANGRSSRFWRLHFLRVAGVYGGGLGWCITQAVWLIPLLNYVPYLRVYCNSRLRGQSAMKGLERS